MIFTGTERRYLITQALGRLATIGPTGAPHNHPVTYRVNEDTETIDTGWPHDLLSLHPRRIVAWNLDAPGSNNRDIAPPDRT